MQSMTGEKFPLENGRCPVCEQQVEIEVEGVRTRFVPHDDPDWCRAMARYNAKTLRRVIEQTGEDLAIVKHREAFYRRAFAVALRKLAEVTTTHPDEWREPIERRIREENAENRERQAISHMLAEREIAKFRG